MKKRIEAEQQKLQVLVGQIDQGKKQISEMEDVALRIQGRIHMLQELDKEASQKEVAKKAKKKPVSNAKK